MPEIKWLRKGGVNFTESAPEPIDETETPLENKTVAELKDMAGELGIDLTGITKKADILAAIQAVDEQKSAEAEGGVQE